MKYLLPLFAIVYTLYAGVSVIESDITLFITLFFLITLSGLFSGSEIAMVSLSSHRVRRMVEDNIKGSQDIYKLKSNPNRLLITILIGNNLVNIFASVIATAWATITFGSSSLGFVTGVLTIIVIIFGEILPKSLAQHNAENFAKVIAKPLLYLEYLLLPIIYFLEYLLNYVTKKLNANTHEPSQIMMNELKVMIKMAGEKGYLDDRLEDMIFNIFSFSQIKVKEIMTIKDKVITISINSSVDELRELFIESQKSRIPVFKNSDDNIVGIVTLKSLLGSVKMANTISDLDIKEPIIVKDSSLISELLLIFQKKGQHLAIVKNEQDKFCGLVSLENVLEEIVGEIFDEKDIQKLFVRRVRVGVYEVLGDSTIYHIKEADKKIVVDESDFKSIGSIFIEQHKNKRVKSGDKILIGNIEIRLKDKKRDIYIISLME